MRRLCEELQLAGREILHGKSNEQLSRWYNGAGPGRWHPEAREIPTVAMGLYEPVILIRDVQFEHSDGTDEGFRKTIADWRERTPPA